VSRTGYRQFGRLVHGIARRTKAGMAKQSEENNQKRQERELLPRGLLRTEHVLTGIVSATLQQPQRYTRRITMVAASKLSVVAAGFSITSLIAAFGTASTGTAISSLSGAAANSAILYWIGTWFGGGAVLGGTVLGFFSFGVGLIVTIALFFFFFGWPRKVEGLIESEERVVSAAMTLLTTIGTIRQKRLGVSPDDLGMLSVTALVPLRKSLESYSSKRLALFHRMRLWHFRRELISLIRVLGEPQAVPARIAVKLGEGQ